MPKPRTPVSRLLAKLQDVGVTHLVGLPDNSSAALFALVEKDPTIQLISVTREGEAFAIASGLWIGGKTPAVIVQNTGLLESGDALRGTASRMGVPLPILVTCRGWVTLEDAERSRPGRTINRDMLVRPDVDSVACMTEGTLNAWGIPYRHVQADDLGAAFDAVWLDAWRNERPVALLLTETLE